MGVFFRLDRGVLFGTESRWSWNATPFCQRKIQPPNYVHNVGGLTLYDNTLYFVLGLLFNGIKSKQNHTAADFLSIICDIPL